jgi:hypothetical protein
MVWWFWSSLAALLLTKVADVLTTWRHIGGAEERNPLAAALFHRFGLGVGIAIVGGLYLAIVGVQYGLVWWLGSPWLLGANGALGFGIAWVQWEVARCNAMGRTSRCTRALLRASDALARMRGSR